MGGVPDRARAERLIELLATPDAFWPEYPVPSVPVRRSAFPRVRYWKGPTWVNTNWAIIEGLETRVLTGSPALRTRRSAAGSHTRDGRAARDSRSTSRPAHRRGHGADDFSWTAALTIDLALREPAP